MNCTLPCCLIALLTNIAAELFENWSSLTDAGSNYRESQLECVVQSLINSPPMHSMGLGIAEHLVAAGATKDLGSIELLARGAHIKLVVANLGVRVCFRAIRVPLGALAAVITHWHPEWHRCNLVT